MPALTTLRSCSGLVPSAGKRTRRVQTRRLLGMPVSLGCDLGLSGLQALPASCLALDLGSDQRRRGDGLGRVLVIAGLDDGHYGWEAGHSGSRVCFADVRDLRVIVARPGYVGLSGDEPSTS